MGCSLIGGTSQNPLGQQLEFVGLEVGLSGHGDGSVHAGTTRFDASSDFIDCIGLTLVLGGHIFVGRTDQLAVNRMSRHTSALGGQGLGRGCVHGLNTVDGHECGHSQHQVFHIHLHSLTTPVEKRHEGLRLFAEISTNGFTWRQQRSTEPWLAHRHP